jgi:hypothetical protein
MLAAIIERTHGVSPDLWRRYFTIIIDGLQTERRAITPIDTPALDQHDTDTVVSGPRTR